MHLLFSILKVLFWYLKKQPTAIKTDLKMPSMLSQSTTSTRSMQIYMDVGVSLLRFKYPETLKKALVKT